MSKSAPAKPKPKPIGLQFHVHVQKHKCSQAECAENRRFREAQREIEERGTVSK